MTQPQQFLVVPLLMLKSQKLLVFDFNICSGAALVSIKTYLPGAKLSTVTKPVSSDNRFSATNSPVAVSTLKVAPAKGKLASLVLSN